MSHDKTTIILVRHGETEANKEGIFRGRADFPLNENGLRQAEALARELARFKVDFVISSPLSRALKTAQKIAESQSCPLRVDERFTNISLGKWEGVPHKVVAEKYPREYELWLTQPEKLKIPGGETLSEVMTRSVAALVEYAETNSGRTFVVVSHRAVLKPLIAGLLEIKEPYFWKIHMDTGAYTVFHHTKARGFVLYVHNYNRHISKLTEEHM